MLILLYLLTLYPGPFPIDPVVATHLAGELLAECLITWSIGLVGIVQVARTARTNGGR